MPSPQCMVSNPISPQINTPSAQVNNSVGPYGMICACGTGGSGMVQVWGKIVNVGTVVPPNSAPLTGAIQGAISGSNWYIMRGWTNDIPGAIGGSSGSPVQNELIVWLAYPGPYPGTFIWNNSSRTFNGVSAQDTDCGSGQACPNGGMPMIQGAEISDVVDIAPLVWAVNIAGFRGGSADIFNGYWVLSLRRGPGLLSRWDNGGNGQSSPRVELQFTQLKSSWQLEFRHGNFVARYRTPLGEWKNLNTNAMRLEFHNLQEAPPDTLYLEPI